MKILVCQTERIIGLGMLFFLPHDPPFLWCHGDHVQGMVMLATKLGHSV